MPRVLAAPSVQPQDNEGAVFEGARLIAGGFFKLLETSSLVHQDHPTFTTLKRQVTIVGNRTDSPLHVFFTSEMLVLV